MSGEQGKNCGKCLYRNEKDSGEHCKPCIEKEVAYQTETKFTGFVSMEGA